MERMKTGVILMSSLLLTPNLKATSEEGFRPAEAALIVPSITISEAVGANPGTIYITGQTPRTVNVAWNAGSDWTHCEIYYTVNNANQTELGRGHDGTKPLTVTAGNAYHLWMVVYPGGGQVKVVTELRVVAEREIVPELPPPPPPSAGGGIGAARNRDPLARKKDVGSAYYVAINNVRVETGPRHLMIRFKGPPNDTPYVAIGRGPAITRNNELVFGDNLIGGGFVGSGTVTDAERAQGQYMFASAFGNTFSEDALEPGGTYYYLITIPAGAGKRPYQETDKFTMAGEATRVRLVWDKVLVEDDSDDLSSGDLFFWFWANFGQSTAQSAHYLNQNADSDHTYDLRKSVVIENAPKTLLLSASGRDDDSGFLNSGFEEEGNPPDPLSGPFSRSTKDENVAKGEFDLTQYATGTRVPFRLNSMSGGALKFVVFGYFDVTRATVAPGSGNAENIGTTSSGLTTAPAPKTVRAGARVRGPAGTTTSTLTKCEAARLARERNSPAAPGLEAQCLAEQKR